LGERQRCDQNFEVSFGRLKGALIRPESKGRLSRITGVEGLFFGECFWITIRPPLTLFAGISRREILKECALFITLQTSPIGLRTALRENNTSRSSV